ncbi:MAG TPA: hypothetical protein PKD98_29655, partial [Anaerolineae bacterium]|nr:hypothetical protein [Anaerolineae bacterium]
MLELHLARQMLNQNGYSDPQQKIELIEKAQHLYQRARLKGRIGSVWGKVSGRSLALLDLKRVLTKRPRAGQDRGGT